MQTLSTPTLACSTERHATIHHTDSHVESRASLYVRVTFLCAIAPHIFLHHPCPRPLPSPPTQRIGFQMMEDHNHFSSTLNGQFCSTCQELFKGVFIPSASPTSLPGCVKMYRFHGSLENLRHCAEQHACPLCHVVAASDKWGGLPDSTETVFSHSREEEMMVMGVMAHGAPDQTAAYFVTLWKGTC